MKASRYFALLAVIVLVVANVVTATAEDVTEIMKKTHLMTYYAGDDGVSEVHMRIIDKRGRERIKQFVMLRLDEEEGGRQKYYMYFKKPSDIARLTFMVHKTPDGNDRRWIYVPAVDLIKPISADDKNISFVGSHFSYEDVSGRHWTEDEHRLLGDSTIDGRAVFVVESIPRKAYKGFARKVSYIDRERYLPLREEYFDKKGRLARVFRAEKVEEVDGIVTMTVRSMENVKNGGRTVIEFSNIDYNVGIDGSIFTERYLKNPPRKYIR